MPLHQQPCALVERPRDLERPLRQRQARCEAPLQAPDLPLAQAKVLRRVPTPWEGRTVLGERPEVAMDKHAAERLRRHPGVGRKNSDGAGSVWSAPLAAGMFRVIHTVLLWRLTPHPWLYALLQACADHGGQSPTDLNAFLPWQRTPERKEALARPVPVTWPSLASAAHQREDPEAADPS